jgi:effector-binding domain-containing protein
MQYDITTRHVPDQAVVSVRGWTDRANLSPFVGNTFGELYGRLQRLGVAPDGDALVIYHEFGADGIDAEVCVPVATNVDLDVLAAGGLLRRVIPGSTVAQTTHVGAYEALAGAYDAVASWIREGGYEPNGPARERYQAGPADRIPETAYRTLIEFPVSEALVGAR